MTKRLIPVFIAAALSFNAMAQQTALATNKVPQNVVTSFQGANPNVSNVSWTEEQGYFQPNWTANGQQHVGYIDLKGNYIQTVVKVNATALPAAAATYIHDNYNGEVVSEAGRIDFPRGRASRFYAKMGNGTQLLFDKDGKFIYITQNVLKQ